MSSNLRHLVQRAIHSLPISRAILLVSVVLIGAACTGAGAATSLPTDPASSEAPEIPDLPAGSFADGPDDAPASSRTADESLDDFLTAVLVDVDQHWSDGFESVGLPAPYVEYHWTERGEQVTLSCTDEDGAPVVTDDSAALYCAVDDLIVVSEELAASVWDSTIADGEVLLGDFAVAYVVAHEYAHAIQSELLLDRFELPSRALELHADCWAGVWAASAYDAGALEDGDIEEALNAAALFGDEDVTAVDHHGTSAERVIAFSLGYVSGHPLACSPYVVDGALRA